MSLDWKALLAARETETHFVVEGRHAVERLQTSSYSVERILRIGTDLTRREASELLGFHFHRSHLAIARKPENPPLSALVSTPGTVVVLPEIADPGNLGTIVRNTAGLGGAGIILGKGASPWNAKAVRASAGALFRIFLRRSASLTDDLRQLARSHTLIGTSLSPRSVPLANLPVFAGPAALLLGPEDFGLTGQLESLCHHLVRLPMSREIDSLNVASASAVFLYELQNRSIAAERTTSPLPNT